jgi:hypothetical protein
MPIGHAGARLDVNPRVAMGGIPTGIRCIGSHGADNYLRQSASVGIGCAQE